MPAAGDLLDFMRLGEFGKPVGFLDRTANAKVSGGQHIVPSQGENQKHLRRPLANAFYGGQMRNYFFVRTIRQSLEHDFALHGVPRQIANVNGLLARQAQPAHPLEPQSQNTFGCHTPVGKRIGQPPEDHARHFSAELLKDNGSHQCFETWLAKLNAAGPDTLDERTQHRVTGL